MGVRRKKPGDEMILQMKAAGSSFREISKATGQSLGSVTGRFYRLRGLPYPSQIAKDAALKARRRVARKARERAAKAAAIRAAVDINNGLELKIAIPAARAAGASFAVIAACLGISKQALHKQFRRSPD
jgi:hypothetical protein